MKKSIKGFSIQFIINIVAHLVRVLVAYFIIKYGPEPELPTSFGKDSAWQLISLFSIIVYNIISLIVVLIRNRKKDVKFIIGFGIATILSILYVLLFCGL